MLNRYSWTALSAQQQEQVLSRPAVSRDEEFAQTARRIVTAVRERGDRALREFAQQFDGVALTELEVGQAEFDAAEQTLSSQQIVAIRDAAGNIAKFHEAQLPQSVRVETVPGVTCERLSRPIKAVGLYVPAGSAPLPSTALMLGVPAKLAGCAETVLCTPPRSDGTADPAVLTAARTCGVDRVFKIGGAQAIGALAFGTETVPKTDKIFGPGNAWVTAAKALVSSDPLGAAVDFPAGPSEVLVIADQNADADYVATDLLAQAEHGPESQVILITTDAGLADRVRTAVDTFMEKLSRRDIISQSLGASSVLLVESLEEAFEISNRYAPEHLILQVSEPRAWLDRVQAAGSVFLGPWSPESIGDYCSGTNHVLPTYGLARSYGSLGTTDFQRAMTVQELTEDGLRHIGPIAETLARLEGLDAHALAVTARLTGRVT